MPRSISSERRAVLVQLLQGQIDPASAARTLGLSHKSLSHLKRRYLHSKLPQIKGQTKAPVDRPVSILRDEWGVAHIEADSIADSYTALGYVMAQDCLWQLDYMRRLAHGRLAETLGGKSLPAVGFGFGDVVLGELLSDKELWPALKREVDDLIFPFTEQEREIAVRLARQLREKGQRVELILDHPKLKRAMADADRIGAQRIWMLGPDEVERGSARVRDLQTGEERDEPIPE